jgi:hypothetical protein
MHRLQHGGILAAKLRASNNFFPRRIFLSKKTHWRNGEKRV